MSDVHRSVVRVIEMGVVEPKTGAPYAQVLMVVPIETARYLSRFMSDPDTPVRWFEVKEIPAPAQLTFPFTEEALAQYPEACPKTIDVPIE